MGIGSAFRFAAEVARLGGEPASSAARPIRSPWSGTTLSKIVWSDVFGQTARVPSRAEAMRVPAIAKGRALICGTLARQPLSKFRAEDKIDADPWMYRTNTAVSPRSRMLWTLDDIIFSGLSLWGVERGAGERILDAARVPPEWWEITADAEVLVNGAPVSAEEVLLLEGPQDGLLEIAAEAIYAARATADAWRDRVEHPTPPAILETTDASATLETGEARTLTAEWDDRRRQGGTAYIPWGIKATFPTATASDLFVAGRNAERLDFANFLALPGALLDGTTATASLTYSTQEGRRNELVDLSLAYWATPIESRLSQDDVVAAGSRVAFDLEYLSTPTQPAQGPSTED